MNSRNKVLGILALSFALMGCGKQAVNQDTSKNIKSIEPTSGEVYFNGYQEIRKAFFNNDYEEFQTVFERFPEIGINDMLKEGETFLTYAIKNDYSEIRNYLISAGANLNLPNVNKETPLIVAIKNNRLNSLLRLIDLSVDMDRVDNDGNSALHSALKLDYDDMAIMLINSGAKIQQVDKNGKTALKIAQEQNTPEALALMMILLNMEYGAPDVTSFRRILSSADYKSLSMVLDRYPYLLKESTYDALNPFSLLIDSQNEPSAIKSAEILIKNQGNVDGPETSIQTPLIKAVKTKKKVFVNILLTANANPHYIDLEGKSALIHGIEVNDFDLVNLLLSYSAMEKYTVRVNDKKITFNACTTAKNTAKKLKTPQEKETNEKIKKILDCGFLNWLFG